MQILELKQVKYIQDENNKDNFICIESGFVKYEYKGKIKTLIIEEGFECDLSSIPNGFSCIFPKELIALAQGGFFHDKEYRDYIDRVGEDRKEVDLLYKAILENLYFNEYVPIAKFEFKAILKWSIFLFLKKVLKRENAEIFYLIVRIFGREYYIES